MSDDKQGSTNALEPRTNETFGLRVGRLLKEKGFKSQAAFARKVGVDRTRLNRVLKEHADPHPQEIAWIAEALGETADALLDGIELPQQVRKAIDDVAEHARRVYAAERECDEAKARLARADERQAGERKQWVDERAGYLGTIAKRDREIENAKNYGQHALAKYQEQVRVYEAQMTVHREEIERERDELLANNAWLLARVQLLEQQLAAAKSNVAGSAFGVGSLALLGGIMLGASGRRS
jgi:transcriptional regulator with XRE-family HTH domain